MVVARDDYILDEKTAQKVFDKFNLEKVKTIVDYSSNGINNYAFEINGKYFLRMARRDSARYLDKERFLADEILTKYPNFPMPHVLHYDNSKELLPRSYQVLTKINGDHLDEEFLKLSNEEKIKLGKDFGRIVKQIHSIHFDGIGYFEYYDDNTFGRIDKSISWEKFFNETFQDNINVVKKHNAIDNEQIDVIKRYYNSNKKMLLDEFSPCLIHNDIAFQNFKIKNDKISGVFDFEWAFSGDRVYELAKLEYNIFKKYPEIKETFLKEYCNDFNLPDNYDEKIKFYKFCDSFTALAGNYEDNEPNNPIKYLNEMIDIMKE